MIFPAQIHDAKAAIRWVRANAQKYHVNPDKKAWDATWEFFDRHLKP